MNRRLMTILVPLVAATLISGCSTFSDNDAIARVDDVELSDSELDDLLEEQGIPDDQRSDLDIVRSVISGWIESTAIDNGAFSPELIEEIPDDDLVALYRQGLEAAGVTCAFLLVAPSLDDAESAAESLRGGSEFSEVFDEYNVDPDLAAVGGDAGCFDFNQVAGGAERPPEVIALLSVNSDNVIATSASRAPDGAERGLLIRFQDTDDLAGGNLEQVIEVIRQNAGPGIVLDDIDVHVDSRYGTFDRATGAVVALT